MAELAFFIAVVIAGLTVLIPVTGFTLYFVTRPWLNAYAARQHALAAHIAREERAALGYTEYEPVRHYQAVR